MRFIVGTWYFSDFLNVQVNNCERYFLHLNTIDKKLHIRTDQDDSNEHGEFMWIESFRDAEDIELDRNQLFALKRFLKAIPNQPIVIEMLPDSKIKCLQFIAEF